MKNTLLVLLCLITTSTLKAQQETDQKMASPINEPLITLNVITPFQFNTPRYQLGYIHTLNDRWKIGADIGYGSEAISIDISNSVIDSEDYQLMEARTEIYYMLNSKRKWNHYLSAELFLIKHEETFLNESYRSNDETATVFFDSADYTRIKQGINIKYGAFFDISEKLGVNFYYGFGVRVRDNKFENLVNFEINEGFEEGFTFGDDYRTQQGRRVGFNVALGLKLYYKL